MPAAFWPTRDALSVGGGLRPAPSVLGLDGWLGTPGTRREDDGEGGGGIRADSVKTFGRGLVAEAL